MEIVCVAVAAWAFDRLAVARFGRSGRIAAIVFAAGTSCRSSIGQEPYLLGETIGLVALVAAHARHWRLALPLAVACALASPLDRRLHGARRARLDGRHLARAPLGRSSGSPRPRPSRSALLELLFPGQGTMPFATLELRRHDCSAAWRWARSSPRGATARWPPASRCTPPRSCSPTPCPSAIGTNITRLGISFGVALVVALARREPARARAARSRPRCRSRSPSGCPRWGRCPASSTRRCRPPTSARCCASCTAPTGRSAASRSCRPRSTGRPPTSRRRSRSRAAGSASSTPPTTRSSTSPGGSPRAPTATWLFANGVRFVALPDVALDYAAKAEARLVRHGVPGLTLVWQQRALARVLGRGRPGHRLRAGAPACARTARRSC